MQKDFKESYIDQQKMQAAERQARLAKIGMGSENANPASAVKPQVRPAAQSQQRVAAQPQQRVASQTQQRPAAQPQQRPAAQPQQRPASQTQQRVAAQPQSRPATQIKNNRPSSFDEEPFFGELSDNESRAMMFALTGKAQTPDDGGDVDIINMGLIKAPGRRKRNSYKKKSNAGLYVGRTFGVLGTLILFVVIAVFATVGTIAYGPSETVRDLLVQSAMQASATKWVPYVFLPGKTVDEIINKSEEVVQDVVSLDDYNTDSGSDLNEDEWANAKDGMIFETVNGSTFKAYVLLVRDPSRIYVGTSTDDFSNSKAGVNVFQAAERYNAVACINAGEFLDNGGHGSGYAPLGLTSARKMLPGGYIQR